MNQLPSQLESARPILPTAGHAQVFPAGGASAGSEADPVRLVLKNLRGRVAIAAAIGVVLAIAGAITPWLVLKPVYTATGLIRVAPSGRVILFQVEDNQPLSHYDSYVNTQQQLLMSRRILGSALEHETLAQTSWPRGGRGIEELGRALEVTRARGAEIINIALTHEDPTLAAAALNAVLAAYEKIQIEGEARASEEQERLLADRLEKLGNDVISQRNAARQAALPVTPEALQRMMQVRSDDLAALRSTITEVRMRPDEPAGGGLDPGLLPPLPVDQISEAQLRSILARQDADFAATAEFLAQTERDLLVLSSRVGPQHREYVQLSSQRDSLRVAVAERMASFRDELRQAEIQAAASADGAPVPAAAPLTLIERLEAEERLISEEIFAVAQKLQGVQGFLDEAERLDAEVAEVRDRLDQLRFERQDRDFGRITIEERAAVPSTPSTDRRLPLSVAGSLAGLGGGVGLVVLFGLLRPAIRYSDEASELRTTAPLLAAIPDLTAGSPEDREAAAFSVHHLRQLIEAGAPAERALSLAVTSPGPGDGKTQITLSLAASFASAGRRVVAIDLDFIGRGLSRATRHDGDPGLAEHLAQGHELAGLTIAENGTPFAIIPAGDPGANFPATLNTARLRSLLDTLRAAYDVVLIDTGPVLGSLEASAVVGAADSTLVIVGRGQKPPLVRAALARITSLAGRPLGLVFNRASSLDVNSSLGSISLRSGGAGTAPRAKPGALAALYTAPSDPDTPRPQ